MCQLVVLNVVIMTLCRLRREFISKIILKFVCIERKILDSNLDLRESECVF
jgi:hypothetical protein